MSSPTFQFRQVTRRFGDKTALDAVSLSVEPGTVFGLVGRNGAGKTTSLRLALGLLHADSGDVRVLGLDPAARSMEVRTRVSLLSEESHLYPWMTVQEIRDFCAALHPRWDAKAARELSERLELNDGDKIETLSRGTRAKVALVLSAACRPELLLLDDPTAGLDPLVRREVLQGVLQAVSDEGGTVVYASHLIHDVERVADRVAFLDDGRVRLDEPLEKLKAEFCRLTAVFSSEPPACDPFPGQLVCEREGRTLVVVARGDADSLASHARSLGAHRVEIDWLSLEEILVACLQGRGPAEVTHA